MPIRGYTAIYVAILNSDLSCKCARSNLPDNPGMDLPCRPNVSDSCLRQRVSSSSTNQIGDNQRVAVIAPSARSASRDPQPMGNVMRAAISWVTAPTVSQRAISLYEAGSIRRACGSHTRFNFSSCPTKSVTMRSTEALAFALYGSVSYQREIVVCTGNFSGG
jgi:hypothetical protein